MYRLMYRLALMFAVVAATAAPASAQINWNVTYQDVTSGSGVGFDDHTVVGTTTVGQLRQASITAALNYWGTVLDGRGTTNLTFDTSLNLPSNSLLAQFGPDQIVGINGSFQNGGVYQAARTNQHLFSGPDGDGQFNFGHGWNYVGQTPNSSNFDMVTVAIHEIGHGLGFTSYTNPRGGNPVPIINGEGLATQTPGTPDIYSGFDRYLQKGNGTGGSLFNTNIASSNYGSFTGNASVFTAGNNASTGLFFGGQYTREVLGGPAPLYAPNPYEPGSSTSHVNDANAVMNPTVTPNTVKRLLNYEIAMMIDIGWNQYDWNSTSGNWGDGASNVAQSRWTSSLGIVSNGSQQFNTFAHPNEAPVLPVYGQVTSNIILNFSGSGSSQYTSTNDLGNIRLVRMNLNSTSTATNTITGGSLQFGVSSDGTAAILTPKIVQQNSGAFAINSDLIITDTTALPTGGWSGLTVDGTGSGRVSLGGVISGTGTLSKAGTFTLELNGTSANTYTGMTTVNSGVLLLNKTPGVNAIAGSVTINTGGTLQFAGANQMSGTGTMKLSGGTLSTGASTGFSNVVGSLQLTANSTIALGSGSHTLMFNGITGTPSSTLTITNWSGSLFSTGTAGLVEFSGIGTTPNTTYASFLSTVQFQSFGTGATFLDMGGGVYQLVPTPEPTTILALATAALGAGTFVRRRFSRKLADNLAAPRLLS